MFQNPHDPSRAALPSARTATDGAPRLPWRPAPPGSAFGDLLERGRAALTGSVGGVAALVVLALVAGLVFYRVGVAGGGATAQTGEGSTRARGVGAARAPTTTTGPALLVHVAGAVLHPGVVELATGARVIDAVEAAGGALPEADLDRLNLAAKLADGERVLVQRVGEPLLSTGGLPGTEVSGPLNLNTATAGQLEELPGIGPALAAAILAERDRRGGFRSVNELRDVRGIGEQRFADIRDLVAV